MKLKKKIKQEDNFQFAKYKRGRKRINQDKKQKENSVL